VKSRRLAAEPPTLRTLRATPAADERPGHERALAEALMRGDRSAGGALWDHFSPLVRGLLARAFGPAEGVEDGLQDVFLHIFHKGRSLRDPGSLRSFVVAVTVHFIRSELRKRKLRRAIWSPFPRPPAAEPEPSTAAAGAPRLALAALYRALDTLSVGERLAFSLRFFEGVPVGEGAALSRMSLATFKRRLASARQKIWTEALADPWLSAYTEHAAPAARQPDATPAMRLGGPAEEGES
jgi:RNA polymerase sigma-70 factor (ECF subfamily)